MKEGNFREKMLLSFKADVYERVLAGTKIYEYRKVFSNEPIEAYLYVSSPKQVIIGKMIIPINNRLLIGLISISRIQRCAEELRII